MDLSYTRIKKSLKWRLQNHLLLPLYPLYKPYLIKRMRKKDKIKVVFVLSELGKWKTESLYNAMKRHERFSPMLVVVDTMLHNGSEKRVMKYLDSKGYPYTFLEQEKTITDTFHPDIIFYQEPYENHYLENHYFTYNLRSLFCYVNYAFHSMVVPDANNMPLYGCVFQLYFENESTLQDLKKSIGDYANNGVVTGLPMTDILINSNGVNPWKILSGNRKKIIWAPHHTLPGGANSFLVYSTFLKYSDFMLEMADKYKDSVQFAFKPHPLLKMKLEKFWSKEEIDNYYNKWASMPNTQIEEGDYVSLFQNSDAMIHDCSSFQIEYHYTHNPALYLCDDIEEHERGMNTFAKRAFELHYIGKSEQDIEQFINNVINGVDTKRDERLSFYKENLLPPYGKAASDNIINAILGYNG